MSKPNLDKQSKVDSRVEASRRRSEGTTRKRVPLGAPSKKLTINDHSDQLNGFVPRWINDDKNRILEAINGGYIPVYIDGIEVGESGDLNTDRNSWVSQTVGTKSDGSPMVAYLMKIHMDLYTEDQKDKQSKCDLVDQAIYGEPVNEKSYKKNVQYSVNSKI